MANQNHDAYKVVIIGNGGVGKTTFIKRLMGINDNDIQTGRYIVTSAYARYDLHLNTNHGVVRFDVWDTSGQEPPGVLREEYYQNSDAGIIMFALSANPSFVNVKMWDDDLCSVVPNIPRVLIGNCADEHQKVKERSISGITRRRSFEEYIKMTATTDRTDKLAEPFLRFAEKLMELSPNTLHLV
ncbi:hypothetical protein ACHAWU_005097 [Discostella pseudostelligera]|uniref:Uncharacterized protein n=1 Tax=Discostella pseudostelligera TaxID=259834 RepID=A0ABD3LYL4_9STRA